MPEIMFALAFLMLVFLPCLAAVLGMRFRRAGLAEIDEIAFFPPRALGAVASPFCALGEERPVAEEFEIRSFPKGLAVRRRMLESAAAALTATVTAAVEKVVAAPTVAVAARQVVAAVAVAGAEAGVYPRTHRRVLMLQMLADKAEAEAWSARAAAARRQLSTLESADLFPQRHFALAEEERHAREAARDAGQRVAKCEALLQGRADLEMRPATSAGEFVPVAAGARAA